MISGEGVMVGSHEGLVSGTAGSSGAPKETILELCQSERIECGEVFHERCETETTELFRGPDEKFLECPEHFFIGDDGEDANEDSDRGLLYTLEWCSGLTYVKNAAERPIAEEFMAVGEDEVEEDLPLEEHEKELFKHVCRGHVPYLA